MLTSHLPLLRMAGEGGLLDIGYGMDPLSVLGDELRDMPLDPDAVKLVQTEGVQQDLAVVAPWLKNREPFILVRGGGSRTWRWWHPG